MTRLFDLKPGDPVVVNDLNRGARRTEVSKVGAKYLHVGRSSFDRLTGRVNDRYGNQYAYSMSEWDSLESVRVAKEKLRSLGLNPGVHVKNETVLRAAQLLAPLLPGGEG